MLAPLHRDNLEGGSVLAQRLEPLVGGRLCVMLLAGHDRSGDFVRDLPAHGAGNCKVPLGADRVIR
jgi:hypothetical protein